MPTNLTEATGQADPNPEGGRVPKKAAKRAAVELPDELRSLSLHEVAAALGVGYDTVYDRANLGTIPGVFRVGKRWRVRYLEFRKWFDMGCPRLRRDYYR